MGGFPLDRELIEWGEKRVCFRCDRTTSSGALHGDMWFCDKCWATSRMQSDPAKKVPESSSSNAGHHELSPRDIVDEVLLKHEALGIKGKFWMLYGNHHKLTLLRERC